MNIIKATTNKEKNDAFQIRTIVFVEEQNVPIKDEMDKFDAQAIHFVGYLHDQPIAASRLRWTDTYGKLERLCILKEHRGKSYGTKMIQVMEAEILKRNYHQAKLNAQTQAIKFYEQLGYKVKSNEFIDAGIPHVTMVKQLNEHINCDSF